jgi:hypothetical protein
MKAFFFILLISNLSSALCQKNLKVLYFANGMFNSRREAKASLNELRKAYELKSNKENFNEYQVAYNTDEPALLQLFEVYRQKSEEYGLGFWKWIKSFKGAENNKEIEKLLQEFYSEQRSVDVDLRIQIKDYNKYLKNGFQIITVAHSQGNFYTNFSFAQINSEKTKMISVATPASSVFRDGPYYTFKSDGVISHIPSALVPNREKSEPGLFDHAFVNHYLKEKKINDEIIDSIQQSIIKTSVAPSLNPQQGYMNNDLIPILNWFNGLLEKQSDVSPSDCMLAYAMFNAYKLSGLTCEERNLKNLQNVLSACAEDLTEKGLQKKETACVFYRGMEMGNPYEVRYPWERQEFFQKYPHCKIDSMDEFISKISISAIQSALEKSNTLK